MNNIKNLLTEVLAGVRRTAILGCGSPLRGDDAAGTLIAERLSGLGGSARAFSGSTAPENFTGEIKRFCPDTLLVIDAADMAQPPGAVSFIPIDEIDSGAFSFSTHMLPLRVMLDYLTRETGCRAHILGIQGAAMEFGADMTPEVKTAVEAIVSALTDIFD